MTRAATVARGVASSTHESSAAFLKRLVGGAYTTARTLDGGAERGAVRGILLLDDHVARIADGAAASIRRHGGAAALAAEPPLASDWVRSEMILMARVGCDALDALNEHGASVGAVKLTWTLVPPESGAAPSPRDLHMHVAALPLRRAPPIVVVAPPVSAVRSNPLFKDTAWIDERRSLEQLMQGPCGGAAAAEEVLLVDASGGVLEGTQTNFFALDAAGCVVTAGDGVLEGTVRRLVLEVCEAEGIPLELRAPRLCEHASWEGAFIGSTSRLVMPIDAIDDRSASGGAGSGGEGALHEYRRGHPTIARIERLVEERARASCTLITDDDVDLACF